MHTLVQVLTALRGALTPVGGTSVVCITRPYLIECRNVIRWVGIGHTGHEGDQSGLGIHQGYRTLDCHRLVERLAVSATGHRVLHLMGLHAVEDILGFLQIVDFSGASPTVVGKDKGCDEIELTVGRSALGIGLSVALAAPAEIALLRTILHLHILLAPPPQTVEDVLAVELHGYHQAV